ncbi:ABC-type multidrug transport system, ATPase and permease component [Evansella caseinilytica]|uniref:ABC-type multidrug transport system, ATPase and permease component n=1 Tax=Evansella caseinilytica TaxID=1503961 RepID=A0A1H3U8A7_9BACI|nr:ABC-type multidrug transport system, ATPase and permease component [Evansella caseinilytica]
MTPYRQLIALFAAFRRQQFLLLSLILTETVLTVSIPFLIKHLIDKITESRGREAIFQLGLLIIAISLCAVVINVIQHYQWHKLRLMSIKHLRAMLFEAAMKKRAAFLKKNHSGDILTKIIDDGVIVAQHLSIGIPMLIANAFRLLIILVVMLFISPALTLVVLTVVPFYYILFNYLNKKLRETSKQERVGFSGILNAVQEILNGIDTIKLFNKESFFSSIFSQKLDGHFHFVKRNLFFNSIGTGATTFIITMLPVAILLTGSSFVLEHSLSLGGLIAFYSYLAYLYEPINNLSDYQMGVQTALGSSDRVFDFLHHDVEPEDGGAIHIDSIQSIEFRNVSFAYDSAAPALTNLSFAAVAGDKVAIVGRSGSGKTTLINLLMKVYDGYDGEIFINNIDIRQISRSSLYKRISLVEQNVFVFEGSVKENILFDNRLEDAEVEEILRVSQVK